jgi:hypothetical protein
MTTLGWGVVPPYLDTNRVKQVWARNLVVLKALGMGEIDNLNHSIEQS